MDDTAARIQIMQDMFLGVQKLYCWHLHADMELDFCNCPNQDFFYNLFCISRCSGIVKDHFGKSHFPLITTDQMGFAWIADCECDAAQQLKGYYLLGPFFSMEASEIHIRKICYRMHLSDALIHDLLSQLKLMPVIHLHSSIRYGLMLHYCITGTHIESGNVTLRIEASEESQEDDWGSSSWHGTWVTERELFNRIKDGNLDNFSEIAAKFAAGNIGTLSQNDPLRQVKNEGIVFVTLCSRAAILGGVSPEGGYNLSDYYIQRIEAADSVSAAQYVTGEMVEAFVRRVRQAKQNSQYSSSVAACMEYIETHICEKISLDAMAKELGYSSYYLSSKFQKESGMSLNSYINRQKVEIAKQLLCSPALNAADVSERLCFSSPSYFTAIFRKFTGVTPSAYQQNKLEKRE